jgi:hypothetical protein
MTVADIAFRDWAILTEDIWFGKKKEMGLNYN